MLGFGLGLGIKPVGAGTGFGGAAQSVVVPYETNYPFGGGPRAYNAYATYFSSLAGKVKGVDYDAIWTVKPGSFPNQSKLDWYVPKGTPSVGVWGYNHIDFNTNNAVPLSNISALTTTFNWSYTGQPDFNLLAEFWLARGVDTPAFTTDQSVANAAYFEIGLFLHCPNYSFHNGGTLIGTTHTNNGVVYTCRQNTRYITFARQSQDDGLAGSFDWVAACAYLVFHGVISGSEWISGYAPLFGIEPTGQAGTGTYGGTLTINSLSTTYTASAGAQSADYLGTDGFANSNDMTLWDRTGLATPVAAADMDGGNTAAVLLELSAGSTTHDFIKNGAYVTVDSREMDYVLFEDFKADKGRTKFQQYLANGNGGTAFGHQLKSGFDTVAMTAVDDIGSTIGTLLTLIGPGRQIINMNNGWYRAITAFRKAAGVTQLFYDFLVKDATGATSYVGDVTKGVTMRVRHRLPALQKIVLSGTPTAGATGVAYSFVPTVRGGKSPLVFSFVSGSLPSGWSINTSTGEISGTTSTSGTVTGAIRATGNDGITSDLAFSAVVTAAPLTTFDPTGAATGTFSEGNRRFTTTAGNLGAKSTSSRSSGVQYAEFVIVAASGGFEVGIMNSSGLLNGWMAQNLNCVAIDSASGQVFTNGGNQGSSGTGALAAGNVISIEYTQATGKVRFGKNGVWSGTTWNVPTGTLFLAAQPGNGSVRIATERAQFAYPTLSDVTAGDGANAWN